MHSRWAATLLAEKLRKPYVHVLFGARQTGKTTLLRQLLPDPALAFNLADPSERGPLLANEGVDTTLKQFQTLEKISPPRLRHLRTRRCHCPRAS